MDKLHYLYKITNQINGKIYIGQSINTQKRWAGHKNQAKQPNPNQLISMAIKKYGTDAFEFEVIATCKSYEDANWTEEELIRQYSSLAKDDKGYNLSLGGETAPKSEEWKRMHSDWHASLTPEEKEIRSAALKKATLNQIATQGHPAKGTKRTPEQLQTLSKARRDHPVDYTFEKRQNMSQAHIGIKDTEETKKKKAERATLAWNKRNTERFATGEIKCNVPGCEVKNKASYRIIDGIRYCSMHATRLLVKGSFDKSPAHNKIYFTEEQIKIILSGIKSISSMSKDFGISEGVISKFKKAKSQ